MSKQSDVKKAIEAIMGEELPEEQVQLIAFFLKVASWDQTNRPGEGNITQRGIVIPPFKSCESLDLLDVSGVEGTKSDGKTSFKLTNFICRDGAFAQPIHVVATPLRSEPVFLTLRHSLVMDPTNTFGIDVEIQAFSWDANGAAAPKIPFNWRCRVGFVESGLV